MYSVLAVDAPAGSGLWHPLWTQPCVNRTSRDRPKSAPYPRLKNSKKTSKCQVFSFTVLENRKFFEKKFSKKLHTQKNGPSGAPGLASASPWRAKVSQYRKTEGGTLWGFSTSILSQNMKKLKKTLKFLISGKNLTMPKKTERGDPLGFSNIHSVAKQQKIEGGPFGEKNSGKKSRSAEKNWKGGPFGLPGYGMVRGKTGKTFFVHEAPTKNC